jgi:uncharacterized membrane protein
MAAVQLIGHQEAPPLPATERDPGLGRLMFFADAVYAIALTLLALELRLPAEAAHLGGRDLLASLLATWPKALGYITSFLIIALIWSGHHRMFRLLRRSDSRLLWLTLLKLGCVAFFPFPAAVMGEHLGDPVAGEFYYGSLLVMVLLAAAGWWYASWGRRLVALDLSPALIRFYRLAPLGNAATFLLVMGLIPLGLARLIDPVFLGYLLALGYIVLDMVGNWEARLIRRADSHGQRVGARP